MNAYHICQAWDNADLGAEANDLHGGIRASGAGMQIPAPVVLEAEGAPPRRRIVADRGRVIRPDGVMPDSLRARPWPA